MTRHIASSIVSRLADSLEFFESVRSGLANEATRQRLAGKSHLIVAQHKTLNKRLGDALVANGKPCDLPYPEAHAEVARRKDERRIAFENKRKARAAREALEGAV